jgi:DNA-binding MarR family transcriptional regulator
MTDRLSRKSGRPRAANDGNGGASNGHATAPRRLEQLLGYALRRAQVRVFQDFAVAMKASGLTPGQLGALLLIDANRGLSQSALGIALGIDRSSVVPLIDRLQQRGWVRRAARQSDRRSHALELTQAGTGMLARLLPHLDAHEQRIAAHLSAAERDQLFALLGRVAP